MCDTMAHLSNTERYIIANNKVKTHHTITDCQITRNTSANGNLGEYFHIEMAIKEKRGEEKKHKFFMKTPPVIGWQTDFLNSDGVFEKEVNFYKDLCARFRKYLTVDVFPECFLAVPGKIVLADAYSAGYRPVGDVTKPLDYEHVKLGLEALARLHAGSIIYEEKSGGKVGEDFPDAARESNFKAGSLGMAFLRAGGEAAAALAPHLDTPLGRDPRAAALFQEHVAPWMDKLPHYLHEDSPHRKVICHGDAWQSNFLYKYDQGKPGKPGKPVSAMLIDFQLTRLSSPAADIHTFMYLSMPIDDLKKYRQSLLDAYYVAMATELRSCGLDPDRVYPQEDFLGACVHYQIVGAVYALLFFPFSRVRPEVKDEATSTDEKARRFFYEDRKQHLIDWYKSDATLRRFINGAADEMYDNFIKTTRGLTEFTS